MLPPQMLRQRFEYVFKIEPSDCSRHCWLPGNDGSQPAIAILVPSVVPHPVSRHLPEAGLVMIPSV